MNYHQHLNELIHDLASPVSALKLILSRNPFKIDEDKKLFELVTKRLSEIVEVARIPNHEWRKKISVGDWQTSILELICEYQKTNPTVQFCFANIASSEKKLELDLVGMKRVLANLINNSLDALTQNKNQKLIKISIEENAQYVTVLIRDNGQGIAENDLIQINKIQKSLGKTSGQGVGLITAKKFMLEHGGQLEINSIQGIGTCVNLHLPFLN